MSEYQAVFRRYEKKYMLTKEQYEKLKEKLLTHMDMDCYGLHTIGSLYFDTDSFQLIRGSGEKVIYKEKLRLRSYGIPVSDSSVYIELKKKYKGVTYKRRMSMEYEKAWEYLIYGVVPEKKEQILDEVDWFIYTYHTRPQVLLFYDRIALFGKEDSEFRVTFDFKVRFRTDNLDMRLGDYGTEILPENNCVMEIKTLTGIPLWFCNILSELGIFPQSFSKYGTVYKRYILPGERDSQQIS